MNVLQSGPWPDLERGTEEGGRILARPVAGGEGKETREREEVMAHLLVYLDRVRGGQRGLVGEG